MAVHNKNGTTTYRSANLQPYYCRTLKAGKYTNTYHIAHYMDKHRNNRFNRYAAIGYF